MYQIGQTVNASVSATGTGLTYVWRWWDGAVDVTSVPNTTKVINRHGTLAWSVDVVDSLGRKATYSDTVVVYKPFTFTNIEVTTNNETTPYSTQVVWQGTHDVISESVAITIEHEGTRELYQSFAPLFGTPVGEVSGTFSFDVANAHTAVLEGTALANNAVEFQDINFRSLLNRAPVVGKPVPTSRYPFKIGTGTTGNMSASAEDPEGSALTFQWRMLAANGWSSDTFLTGVTTPLASGYRSDVSIPTSGESAGTKTVVVRAIDSGALQTDVEAQVVLVLNNDPVITEIRNSTPANQQEINRIVSFYGTATDEDLDPIYYEWQFLGAVDGGSVTKDEYVCTVLTGSLTGTVTGQLTASDGFGGAAVLAIDPVVIVGSGVL